MQYFFEESIYLTQTGNEPFEIPIGGSIGLLVLGDVGTIAWRQELRRLKQQMAQHSQANLEDTTNRKWTIKQSVHDTKS